MKKKLLAVIPAIALVAAPYSLQTTGAASENGSIQLEESEITQGYEPY